MAHIWNSTEWESSNDWAAYGAHSQLRRDRRTFAESINDQLRCLNKQVEIQGGVLDKIASEVRTCSVQCGSAQQGQHFLVNSIFSTQSRMDIIVGSVSETLAIVRNLSSPTSGSSPAPVVVPAFASEDSSEQLLRINERLERVEALLLCNAPPSLKPSVDEVLNMLVCNTQVRPASQRLTLHSVPEQILECFDDDEDLKGVDDVQGDIDKHPSCGITTKSIDNLQGTWWNVESRIVVDQERCTFCTTSNEIIIDHTVEAIRVNEWELLHVDSDHAVWTSGDDRVVWFRDETMHKLQGDWESCAGPSVTIKGSSCSFNDQDGVEMSTCGTIMVNDWAFFGFAQDEWYAYWRRDNEVLHWRRPLKTNCTGRSSEQSDYDKLVA